MRIASCGRENLNILYFQENLPPKSCLLWGDVEKHGTGRHATEDNVIQLMSFACWVIKSTHTNSDYVILIAFPLERLLRKHKLILRYTYLACLFF